MSNILSEIVSEVELDQYFVNTTFTVIESGPNAKCLKALSVRHDQLDRWAQSFRDQSFHAHYDHFDLSQLSLVVIGSTGLEFKLGLMGNADKLSNQMRTLIEQTLSLNKPMHFYCTESKRSTLFVNVCATDSRDWHSVVCSIRVLNSVLVRAKRNHKQLAILDVRQSRHIHRDDLAVAPDLYNISDQVSPLDRDHQTDSLFKLNREKHLYVRLGKLDYTKLDESLWKAALIQLENQGYLIDQLLVPKKAIRSLSSQSLRSSTLDEGEYVEENGSYYSTEASSFVESNTTQTEQSPNISILLSDEQQHFYNQVKLVQNNNQFEIFLWNRKKVSLEESDTIINDINEYLIAPFGVNVNELGWAPFMIEYLSSSPYLIESMLNPNEFTGSRSCSVNQCKEQPKQVITNDQQPSKSTEKSASLSQNVSINTQTNATDEDEEEDETDFLPSKFTEPTMQKNDNKYLNDTSMNLSEKSKALESPSRNQNEPVDSSKRPFIYVPKKVPKQNIEKKIADMCQIKFDEFIISRLKQNPRERNAHSLRLLLTVTAKHRWSLRRLHLLDRDATVELLLSHEEFIQSKVDANFYVWTNKEDKNEKMFVLLSDHCPLEALITGTDDQVVRLLVGKLICLIDGFSVAINGRSPSQCSFLGTDILYDSNQKYFLLCQSKAIEELINKHKIKIRNDVTAKKPIATVLDSKDHNQCELLSEEEKDTMNLIVEDMTDIAHKTRPDICAAVSILTKYYKKRSCGMLRNIAEQIVHYLWATRYSRLGLKPSGVLNGFTDGSGVNNVGSDSNSAGPSVHSSAPGSLQRKNKKKQVSTAVEMTMLTTQDTSQKSVCSTLNLSTFCTETNEEEGTLDSTVDPTRPTNSVGNEADTMDEDTGFADWSKADMNKTDWDDDGSDIEVITEDPETDAPADNFQLVSSILPKLVTSKKCDFVEASQTGFMLRSHLSPGPWASEPVQIAGVADSDTVLIELVGMARAAAAIHLLKLQWIEMGLHNQSQAEPFDIDVDNQIVIAKLDHIYDQLITGRCDTVPPWITTANKDEPMPQLDLYVHTLLYMRATKQINWRYVPSRDNIADLFTKVTTKRSYDQIRQQVYVIDHKE